MSMMVTGFRMKSGDWIQTVSNVTELKKREDELKRVYDGIDVGVGNALTFAI